MVKHIVMWRLRDNASKAGDAERIKSLLEGLDGKIPGLLKIEVGMNFIEDTNASDVVLYSEFVDRAALEAYQSHPLHLAVVPEVKARATERRSADYFVSD
ncbi:MAG: Dabb family protein [Gammaproteobacteria bacterium]|jgi:quinol monooxygenase YgiN|nr:Dabb family protein [Gammaproteobacteria bacterium]